MMSLRLAFWNLPVHSQFIAIYENDPDALTEGPGPIKRCPFGLKLNER
jgi:hypothetical protein